VKKLTIKETFHFEKLITLSVQSFLSMKSDTVVVEVRKMRKDCHTYLLRMVPKMLQAVKVPLVITNDS